jgi:hypothetical protein
MDVRDFGAGTSTVFDAEDKAINSVSRLLTVTADGINDTGGLGDKPGLVTQFTFVPEAHSVFAMLAVLLALTRRPNLCRMR